MDRQRRICWGRYMTLLWAPQKEKDLKQNV